MPLMSLSISGSKPSGGLLGKPGGGFGYPQPWNPAPLIGRSWLKSSTLHET